MKCKRKDENHNGKDRELAFPGLGRTFLAVMTQPRLLRRSLRCISVIFTRFFLFQYRRALFPVLPVSRADHVLDDRIPFNPRLIRIYLDFTALWIRIAGLLSTGFGKRGRNLAAGFIASITGLYLFAFEIYRKNLSTTDRPNYKKGRYFRLIHLVDPHLMCIPSLHVMLMVHSYTAFRHFLKLLEKEEDLWQLREKVYRSALMITEAVLYVKQHSINCIGAALYAVHRYDPSLFSVEDAEAFINDLFAQKEAKDIPPEYAPFYTYPFIAQEDIPLLREHIRGLFRSFLDAKSADWTIPVLEYLQNLP
ncbi:MAG: hypothetical protein LBH07_01235 [Treponema sp.]|jgi:hypothetical protein|nr:hypothetical protein [Treponema sp.]